MRGKLPEALKLARRARVAANPQSVVTPAKLYEMCASDPPLHNHAMREAGYLVMGQEAEDPCKTCGWSPGEARAADPEADAAEAERAALEAEADALLEAEAAELEGEQLEATP